MRRVTRLAARRLHAALRNVTDCAIPAEPTMHRCLNVPEILCAILDAVVQEHGNPHSLSCLSLVERATLAAMARTCRAFHESATDALWSTLTSLDPLVQCLPEHMWRVPSPGRVVRPVLLINPPCD